MLLLLVAWHGDLAVSTRKTTEKAAQVEAGPQWADRRKEESDESSKPGKVVPTGLHNGEVFIGPIKSLIKNDPENTS